jgi:hypothetical protein
MAIIAIKKTRDIPNTKYLIVLGFHVFSIFRLFLRYADLRLILVSSFGLAIIFCIDNGIAKRF